LAGDAECEWLELKASVALSPEDQKKGDKPEDLYWSIANAVIGIMNTYGGAVIIGIDDKNHKVVPLKAHDPRHVIQTEGLEAYLRKEIYDRIWSSNNGNWGTKNVFHTTNPLPPLIDVEKAVYQGEYVAVILVKPSVPCLRIWKGQVEEIRCRVLGKIGETIEIIGSDNMDNYEDKNRGLVICAPYLQNIFDQFIDKTRGGKEWKITKAAHLIFGILGFLFVAFCYILFLFFKENIQKHPWITGIVLLAIVLGFCFFCTSIIFTICAKLMGRKVDYTPIPGMDSPDKILVDHPLWTIEWHCVDMGLWWQTSDEQDTCYGTWKLEKNRAFGNYRILDPHGFMRCWGWQRQVLPVWGKLKKELEERESEKTPLRRNASGSANGAAEASP
jgi:hypothetical protein